ncbi:hypothetical protein [Actinosynnema sp. NPDC020468]|uniref:hypothetical protein n=1 Tax=Actinosynnema sp. NPDC020468 TaxID=3154488 RepID=UPI003404AFD2
MRPRLAVLFAALPVVLAGCGLVGGGGSTPSATTSAKPDDSAAVTYMDKVCSAAGAFVSAPKTPPKLDQNDPVKLKADMAAYMGQMADAFTKTASALNDIGPSPVAGGDEQVDKMAATFTSIAASFADAKTKIEAADANDPTGGLQAAGEAIARMDEFTTPLKELQEQPALRTAAEKAKSCQALRTLSPSDTSSARPTA